MTKTTDIDIAALAKALRAEIEAELAGKRKTFGETSAEWLTRVQRVGGPKNERRIIGYLSALHPLREGELTKAVIENAMLGIVAKRSLGPNMWNKIRSTGKLVVDDAIDNGLWNGRNPFEAVARRKVPRKTWGRVTARELHRAIDELSGMFRNMALVGLYTGLRSGEQKALQRQDVDLARGVITVCRSLGRDTTKTGTIREVPIADGCRKALEEAMAASPSKLVFPGPDGERLRDDYKLSRKIKEAFRKARIISGWKFGCRQNCVEVEEVEELPLNLACPKCGWKFWSAPIPKKFDWYALRHSFASWARECGVDTLVIKICMGHTVLGSQTESTYTHITDDYMRAEIAKLRLKEVTPPHPPPAPVVERPPMRLRGEAHKMSRLTEQAVRDIRKRRAAGEGPTALAREYGVSREMIHGVVTRKFWSHID